jgi:hypothetical protein
LAVGYWLLAVGYWLLVFDFLIIKTTNNFELQHATSEAIQPSIPKLCFEDSRSKAAEHAKRFNFQQLIG